MKKLPFLIAVFLIASFPIMAQSWHDLTQLAVEYYHKGDYSKAIEFTEKAVTQAENEYGVTSKEYATSLNNLGVINNELGNHSKAEPLLVEAMNIRKKVLGPEHIDYAGSLNNLALLYADMGSYSKAEPLYLEALNIQKKVLGSENPDYLNFLNNLAALYKKLGNYSKAEPLYLEALNIRKKAFGPETQAYASSLNDLASLYRDMGYYSKAVPLYVDALNIAKKILSPENPDYAVYLNNLANCNKRMGNYLNAEPLYAEALNIQKKVLGRENPNYASFLNNLADLYYELGNYSKAESSYLEVLNIRKKVLGPEHPDYAGSLNKLALLYYKLGNYTKAESLYIEALDIQKKVLGPEHPVYATSLNNLAVLYTGMGNYFKAGLLHLEALNIQKKVLGPEHPNYAASLVNLALVYGYIGNYSKAEPMYLEALNIQKKALGPEHPDYAASLNNLAILYEYMGTYSKAEPLYLEAMNIRKNVLGPEHPDYANSLNNLAVFYGKSGDYSKAKSFILSANENLNNQIRNYFTFLSGTQKEQFINMINYHFDSYNSFFIKRNACDPSLASISYDNELNHKGILLLSNTTLKQAVYNSNDNLLIKFYDHFKDIHRQLSLLYKQPKSERKENADSLENVSENLEKDIMSRGKDLPGISDLKGLSRITWQEIQDALKPDEAAIEFVDFRFYNRKWTDSILYCALVLRKGYKYPKMVYLFEEKQIRDIISTPNATNNPWYINQIYTARSNQPSNDSTSSLRNSLYRILWLPIDSLVKDLKTIYLAPGGLLNKVAFDALAVTDSTLLMDRYNLITVGSTRTLVGNKRNEVFITDDSKAALFGGIEYDADSSKLVSATRHNLKPGNDLPVSHSLTIPDSLRGGINWPYLEGTLTEVTDLRKLFKSKYLEADLFTGIDATRESFESLSENKKSPEIIHIATHGFFFQNPSPVGNKKQMSGSLSSDGMIYTNSVNPLFRSGILFAGASRAWKNLPPIPGVEDGNLTAYEVSNMNLSNTRLVVLSACETGLGDIKGSEGVYGLRRAFKMAGVQYTLMSLWQVPDYQTSELMQLFYMNWLNGMTINEGFKAAQKTMHKKYEPYYWAAFELIE